MLIRSQNKKVLVIMDNLADIRVTSKNQIMATYPSEDAYDYIGEYSTEAKAIKVLDMIQQAYAEFRGDNVYSGSSFQMPSDEEVEG